MGVNLRSYSQSLAKCIVLKEVVEHHVKEEEGEYFPQIKRDFSSEELEELGAQMKTLFDRLESQSSYRSSKQSH